MTDWADETEAKLLDQALALAPGLGWSNAAVEAAGERLGLSRGDLELLLPHGPRDLAALLSRRDDATALKALEATDAGALKIRQRIQVAVEARLAATAAHGEAARRWAGFLALPQNAPLGLKLAWESADAIWRWAGDTATDENHYSKRAILSGILLAALPIRLTSGEEAARAFVAARIDNVMQFEKWKAGLDLGAPGRTLAGVLGRLRYR
jgi:ubiquinone biosynthesis protein COQ9